MEAGKISERVVIRIFYPDTSDSPVTESDVVFLENTKLTKALLMHLGLYQVSCLYQISCLGVLSRETWYALRGSDIVELHKSIGKTWFAESVTPEEIMGGQS